jgi:poly-gamma-glutamate synthesis protein (capsule biosynthesis protein)
MKLCHAMARNGADVILCQHSHCIGAYEKYNDCHILYGQGNFHFGEEEKEIWNTSLAVEYDTESNEISFTALEAKGHGIRFAAEKDELLKQFNMRNESLISGEWKKGWHDFCESKKETYIKAIANAALPESTEKDNARFGHYLDCEAHTDVWRELFPTYNHTNEK